MSTALEDNSVFLDVNLTFLTEYTRKVALTATWNPLRTWLVSSSLYLLNELLTPSLLFKLPTTSSKQISLPCPQKTDGWGREEEDRQRRICRFQGPEAREGEGVNTLKSQRG